MARQHVRASPKRQLYISVSSLQWSVSIRSGPTRNSAEPGTRSWVAHWCTWGAKAGAIEEDHLVWWITLSFPSRGWPGASQDVPAKHLAPECTMGRRQADGGSVVLWAEYCYENLGSWQPCGSHFEMHHLPKVQTTYSLSWKRFYPIFPLASFCRMVRPVTKQKWFGNSFRNTTSLRCWLGLKIVQMPIKPLWDVPDKDLIHGSGSDLVPDSTTHLQRSSGVHASMGQSRFSSKMGTNTMS